MEHFLDSCDSPNIFEDVMLEFPNPAFIAFDSLPIDTHSASELPRFNAGSSTSEQHRNPLLAQPVFQGCNLTVEQFIMHLNSLKIVSHCSWSCIERFLEIVSALTQNLKDVRIPLTLSSFKTASTRLFEHYGIEEDVSEYATEFRLCRCCGNCVRLEQQTCLFCKSVVTGTEKKYVHFGLTSAVRRRMKCSRFVESVREGYVEYGEEIRQGEDGMEGAYRLNIRRLMSEGAVSSHNDIVVNLCIDGVTVGDYSGQTMSFTPVVAQVASMRYADRLNANNLILVGILEGSPTDTDMDGPIDVLVDDIALGRADGDPVKVVFGYLCADHQCLRKLIKSTGDASVCPCERCSIAGTLFRADGGARGRYCYPFDKYSLSLCYPSHEFIMAKIRSLIDLRIANMEAGPPSFRRHDPAIKDMLQSFSFYGLSRFTRLPEFSFRHSVPIDLMHIVANAGDFVRDYLRSSLPKANLDRINATVDFLRYPSENRSSERHVTHGRKWKSVDYFHFILFELPLFASNSDIITSTQLRTALLALSGIVRIASCTDTPKSAIVPLKNLCTTFGHAWYEATGLSGAKLWAHRLLHLWHILASCGVSSDSWLFIFERGMGSLSRVVQSPHLAYSQLRNAAPFIELHKLCKFENLDSDTAGAVKELKLWVPQIEAFDVRVLGRQTKEDTLRNQDRTAVIETLVSMDKKAAESARLLIREYRRVKGKAPRYEEEEPSVRSILRILAHMENDAVLDNALNEYKDPFDLCPVVKIFERMEFACNRGKLYLVSAGWGDDKKSFDYGVCFHCENLEDLHHGEVEQVRAVQLANGEHILVIKVSECVPLYHNRRRAGNVGVCPDRAVDPEFARSRIIQLASIRCKSSLCEDGQVVLFDRGWSTTRPHIEALREYFVKKNVLKE